MLLHEKILATFFKNARINSEKENFEIFELKGTATAEDLNSLSEDILKELFVDLSDGTALITITCDDDPISLSSENSDCFTFQTELAKRIEYLDGSDELGITILISKTISSGLVRVFCMDFFVKFIKGLSIFDFLLLVNRCISIHGKIVFHIDDLKTEFHTNSIYFKHHVPSFAFSSEMGDRKKKIEKINSISHLTGISNNQLLPEDFLLEQVATGFPEIENLFAVACLILSISILYDYCILNNTELEAKINGYKTISARIELAKISTQSLGEYYAIYSWLLEGGSLVDKVGLSRNLISLNLNKSDNYTINEGVFSSIKSGFKVYEKQNVKQYIELRNKIADQIINFNEKAGKIVESFASGFQKSALAFVSLFSSIVIVRVLTTHNFINIFTPDATIISLAFLLISYMYYRVIKKDVSQERERFIDSYNSMKARNGDLLTVEDINLILNHDHEHEKNLEFIDKKEKQYSRLWNVFLIVFLSAIIILFLLYNIDILLKSKIFNLFRVGPKCQC